MRVHTTTAGLALAALALAGCGNDDGATDGPTTAPTETAGTAAAEDLEPVDLPEGVAAEVGETEIAVEQVDQRVDALVQRAEEQATEDDGVTVEQREAAVTTQVLSDLIVGQVILQGAQELGVAPSEEDVSELRSQVAEGAGGEEAFVEQATEAGYDEAAIQRELRVLAAFQNVSEELVAEAGGDTASPAPEEQAAVQQWLLERLEAANITVDEQYGVWDPATGQVVSPS